MSFLVAANVVASRVDAWERVPGKKLPTTKFKFKWIKSWQMTKGYMRDKLFFKQYLKSWHFCNRPVKLNYYPVISPTFKNTFYYVSGI